MVTLYRTTYRWAGSLYCVVFTRDATLALMAAIGDRIVRISQLT